MVIVRPISIVVVTMAPLSSTATPAAVARVDGNCIRCVSAMIRAAVAGCRFRLIRMPASSRAPCSAP
jgi:hypothetical protein